MCSLINQAQHKRKVVSVLMIVIMSTSNNILMAHHQECLHLELFHNVQNIHTYAKL